MTVHSIVIQKLLSANAHVGRRGAVDHFKAFTYGIRNRMPIIDSDKTVICLRSACDFIGSLVRNKGRLMFVNTNPLFDDIVEQTTRKIGCYRRGNNAIGLDRGFLTNSCSPKKFRPGKKNHYFAPTSPPDCIVVIDTERRSSAIHEAHKMQIPVVALVDSRMPWDYYKGVTYPIPANDSVQFVYLFCNLITKTCLFEKEKLAAAEAGLTIGRASPKLDAQ